MVVVVTVVLGVVVVVVTLCRARFGGGVLRDRGPVAEYRPDDAHRDRDDQGAPVTPEAGFAIAERKVEQNEVGGFARHLRDIVLGVIRDGHLLRVDAPEVDALEATDRLLYIRSAAN